MEKSSTTQATNTPRPGRPSIPDHKKKKSRTLTISDSAWSSLEELLKEWDIKSVSELVEKIGTEEIGIFSPSRNYITVLADLPIYKRLKLFIQPPIAVFWSLLAFSQRTAQQLGLADENELDDLLVDVIKRSIVVVFYIGYTFPDIHINNPSALLRWIAYYILKVEAKKNYGANIPISQNNLENENIGECLAKIIRAVKYLNAASHAPHYQALKMKAIDQLTIGQIIKIFELQSYHKDENQVGRMVKKGLYQFRQLWANPDYKTDGDELDLTLMDVPPEANLYYKLAMSPRLDEEEHSQLEKLLLTTSSNSNLDFWMNEIDYYCGFYLNPDRKIYADHQETLRVRIDQEIDQYLPSKKAELDQKISSCGSKIELEDLLSKAIKKEIGSHIPLKALLADNLSELMEIVSHLEQILVEEEIKVHLSDYLEALKSEMR